MLVRGIFAAFAAVLVSATLVGNADAYPTTARSGTSTVTGTFRPLDLSLNLIDSYGEATSRVETSECGPSFCLDIRAFFTSRYSTVGYATNVSGNAGYWVYRLIVDPTDLLTGLTLTQIDDTVINVSADGADRLFGTLTYLGGGSFTGVPPEDTPLTSFDKYVINSLSTSDNDYFKYFTTATGLALKLTSSDYTQSDFSMSFQQEIQHLGPFGSPLDVARTNTACFDDPTNPSVGSAVPCGSVTLSASSTAVPEPASLALVGLGLVALALGRRRQQRQHQV